MALEMDWPFIQLHEQRGRGREPRVDSRGSQEGLAISKTLERKTGMNLKAGSAGTRASPIHLLGPPRSEIRGNPGRGDLCCKPISLSRCRSVTLMPTALCTKREGCGWQPPSTR